MRSRSAAICSSVRPVVTLSGRASVMSYPGRTNSSFSLMRSQVFSESLGSRPLIFTRAKPPVSFSPFSRNFRLPLRNPAWGSSMGSHVPRSQSRTVPPPYWPLGMIPSKPPYSTGWSSVIIARRLSFGSRLGPFGTAQLFSTPSISRRKS